MKKCTKTKEYNTERDDSIKQVLSTKYLPIPYLKISHHFHTLLSMPRLPSWCLSKFWRFWLMLLASKFFWFHKLRRAAPMTEYYIVITKQIIYYYIIYKRRKRTVLISQISSWLNKQYVCFYFYFTIFCLP